MSQYTVTPKNPDHTILIGWDRQFNSYFATVLAELEDGAEIALLSLGETKRTLIHKPELLSTALESGGYCDALSDEMLGQLLCDCKFG